MAPKPAAPTANSGIRKLSNGDSVIPASTRADGSVRKEIRVKAGYRPPEDVEVYKNRTAETWRNRGKGEVPGADLTGTDEKESTSKASAKNAKRKEARKKATAAATHGANSAATASTSGEPEQVAAETGVSKQEEVDPESEKAKEARKLAKKLRQARELQEKKESGDNLLPEQFAKVIKIKELIRQLDHLGFDTDGEKKEAKADVEAAG